MAEQALTDARAHPEARGGHGSWEATLDAVREVEGWLSDAQARRLWERASSLDPGARVVEIGSFRGRSTIVLGRAAPEGVEVVAVDPHAGNDRGPRELTGFGVEADEDFHAFGANLARAGVDGRVRHLRLPSSEALSELDGSVDLLYVDGAHRYRPALDDLRRWGERVAGGGSMLVHDSFSSVGVTFAILTELVASRQFRYLGRTGSLTEYRRQPAAGAARLANAGRQLAELPWFARNLVVKALIVARLRPFTRLLGHRSGTWPY